MGRQAAPTLSMPYKVTTTTTALVVL
ncbi:hypothetical protein CCACVL1_19075 [Corchorus capsularis]|uniref:Uncharacterized protein n=1 Tax=Corchorus capsularis TaxID=210143 RepID=A0A1R3HII3_COCAP|nr:hypothetical protein CCACVL1_19075 [Corchorus capsularis]